MCFVWIWEQTAIISLYNIKWLVFITETESVYCAVRTGSLYIILRSAPHTVSICFVWISEQTAIISLYNINWLVFVIQTESVYCAVRTGSSVVFPANFRLWYQVSSCRHISCLSSVLPLLKSDTRHHFTTHNLPTTRRHTNHTRTRSSSLAHSLSYSFSTANHFVTCPRYQGCLRVEKPFGDPSESYYYSPELTY